VDPCAAHALFTNLTTYWTQEHEQPTPPLTDHIRQELTKTG